MRKMQFRTKMKAKKQPKFLFSIDANGNLAVKKLY
jgi:hypothetical protein